MKANPLPLVIAVLSPFFILIGGINDIIEFALRFSDDASLIYWAGGAIVFVALLVFFIYLLVQPHRTAGRLPSIVPKVLALTLCVTAALSIAYLGWQNHMLEQKVIVLVADFDGPEPLEYRVTDEVLRQLRQALENYEDTVVVSLNAAVSEKDGSTYAQALGRRYHADIVLWGWYGVTATDALVTLHFENLVSSERSPLLTSRTVAARAPVARIRSFELQRDLSSSTVALSLLIVGMTRFEVGDYGEAIHHFTSALNLRQLAGDSATKAILLNYRGMANSFQGNLAAAVDDYTRAILLQPAWSQLYNNRGVALAGRGLTSEPPAEADVLCISWYNHFGNPYAASDVAYQLGFASQGEKVVYASGAEFEQAIADFDQALALQPTFYEATYNRGLARLSSCDNQHAVEDFQLAIQLDPGQPAALNSLGNAYVRLSLFDKATDAYSGAIALSPGAAELYFNRGLAYGSDGDQQRELSDLAQAIRLEPDFVQAYYARSFVYKNLGNLEAAVTDLTELLRIEADNARARGFRADYLMLLQRYDAAVQDYSIVLDDDRQDTYSLDGRAKAYIELGKMDEAKADLLRSIPADSRSAVAFYNRGNTLAQMFGEHELAIADFSRAIEISPTLDYAYNNRGLAYERLGAVQQAIQDYSEAIRLSPEDWVAYANRGSAYMELEDSDHGINDLCRSLELIRDESDRIFITGQISKYGFDLEACQVRTPS
ncbi:MAG: tetratricopeptide repeat protein [Caldilineaceae bacterium]